MSVVNGDIREGLLKQEVRHLKALDVQMLGQILEIQAEWKSVMANIRRDPENPMSPRKFTADHVEVIASESHRSGKTAFEVLIEEWGTMGRNRPRIWYLLSLFLEANLIRAASHITEHILKMGPLTSDGKSEIEDLVRPFQDGRMSTKPPAVVSVPMDTFQKWDEQIEEDLLNLSSSIDDEADNSDLLTMPGPFENTISVPNVPFAYLKAITGDFGRQVGTEDRFIGSGGFAVVYKGITFRSQKVLAIKKLNSDKTDAQQRNELMVNFEVGELTRLKHKFIIEILGYSNDEPESPCLIYPYLENGNLEDHLQMKRPGVVPLNQDQRYRILLGVSEGLHFLHEQPKPLIHRDVKTSNILLDGDLLPKIADFGLLRHASTNNTETVNILGTPRYMAPEAIRGDISVKIDVFSFGVVILEVITGLASFDKTREDRDIITHVQESIKDTSSPTSMDGVLRFLDPKVTNWKAKPAITTFNLAMVCLRDKVERPFMPEVLDTLQTAYAQTQSEH
ncbi:hypothetical protein TCAL_00561 [Tigriopus californicus]|uniref:non-specific serine/threonine protein kinase n=1 Tax=Tigriopus californicus TaxID=6832 RepID=A0A553P9U9_TIGCA|nr:uncharacterized protein LOC131877247 [Tigriopus californicus]TRY74446.1 hypothetical protein TCAL_00561 [Tigriopus californicus]|eukprot:TCALIF_00561-PA protein Name:"Similar to Irak4 Interleukin-1 receptor-associated kinase 4 (Mus musculus)" AED:0.14 eAED:0.14 QI:50/1/0.8/1/1/1/5/0/507